MKTTIALLLLLGSISFAQQERVISIPEDQESLAAHCATKVDALSESQKMWMNQVPLFHRALKISYNTHHRNPNWVFYSLSRDNLMNSCGKRTDRFKADPSLKAMGFPEDLIVTDNDYRRSGFDRGHMAPSGDFLWNKEINEQTFYMTNMSPQTAGLNQKTWNKLEERVRDWACGHGELKVYTGPILEEKLPRLASCVSIPKKFFKILFSYKDMKAKAIAFIYDQSDVQGDPYQEKAVSVRQVEELTGVDFFKDDFSQKSQDEFETQFDLKDWVGTEQNCYACDGKPK